MLLQDLPEKTFHRLLKSVTWTEVDGTFPIKHWLRRFIKRRGLYHGKTLARKRKSLG
jgi:hypothetical protein